MMTMYIDRLVHSTRNYPSSPGSTGSPCLHNTKVSPIGILSTPDIFHCQMFHLPANTTATASTDHNEHFQIQQHQLRLAAAAAAAEEHSLQLEEMLFLLAKRKASDLQLWQLYRQLHQEQELHCSTETAQVSNRKIPSRQPVEILYQYRLKKMGKHSTMTDDRIDALDGIEFSWDLYDEAWGK